MNKRGLIKKIRYAEKEIGKDADIVIKELEKEIVFVGRIALSLIGFTLLLIGLALLFLPGPGIFFIGVGLSLLALEFLFARLIIKRIRKKLKELKKSII